MKKIILFSALLFSACTAFSQVKFDNPAVFEVYNQAMQAFEKQDAQALANLFTANADHINPLGGIVRGKEALIANYTFVFKMFAQMPKPDKYNREVLEQNTRYITPDVVLSTYKERETASYGTKSQVEEMTYSVLLVKKGDKWLIESLTITPKSEMPPMQTAKN